MRQLAQIPHGTADVSRRERRVGSIGTLGQINRIDRLLLVGREHEMRGVDSHEYLLPVGVVQTRADEHAVPLVEQTRVEIELAADELEHVVGRALAHGEQAIGQGRAETELDVVALLAARVHRHQGTAAQRHRRYLRDAWLVRFLVGRVLGNSRGFSGVYTTHLSLFFVVIEQCDMRALC